jgi:hypothetical protein
MQMWMELEDLSVGAIFSPVENKGLQLSWSISLLITQTLYTDDIYVRRYQSNEPGHGAWGSEEVLYP